MAPPAPPDILSYQLSNEHDADVIYPMVYDKSGNIIWDGSTDDKNKVSPGNAPKPFDLSQHNIPNQTVVTLGCKVKDTSKEKKDMVNQATYVSTSKKEADGIYFQNQTFSVDLPSVAGLDAATFQDAYLKLSNPAVAKLLVAVANVISPELVA